MRWLLALALSTLLGLPTAAVGQGWLGPEAAAAARQQLANELPELKVEGEATPWEGRSISLWTFAKAVNGGQHIPNVAQQIGDCVSFGNGHACEYSSAVQIQLAGEGSFHRVFKPYLYGTGRVFVGHVRSQGNGSTGAWQAAALQQYGALAEDHEGVPAYSRTVAMQWGGPPGPPQQFVTEGKRHLVQARLVKGYDQACEALANGWAIAVCSNAGYSCREEAGRLVGRWDRSWAHCMCFIAYDDREGVQMVYCLNSWGPEAHARLSYYQRTGEPPGGFWIRRSDADRMLKQGDSYAISFSGFQRRNLFGDPSRN